MDILGQDFIKELQELLFKYKAQIEVKYTSEHEPLSSIQSVVNANSQEEQTYCFRSDFEPILNGYDLDDVRVDEINR